VARTSPTPPSTDERDGAPIGKGRATPSRAEAEAARRRPLVADTKEARKRNRAELNEKRERARVGMANGEEKYLPLRDRGPQRRLVRDWVDSRWHIAEWIMPLMIIVILLMFTGVQSLLVYAYILLWSFVVVSVIDMAITGVRARRAVVRRFGAEKVEKGLRWYAAMRTMQFRALRMPKPQVKRGAKVS
jgi:Protein of unknown function (DUF3043)